MAAAEGANSAVHAHTAKADYIWGVSVLGLGRSATAAERTALVSPAAMAQAGVPLLMSDGAVPGSEIFGGAAAFDEPDGGWGPGHWRFASALEVGPPRVAVPHPYWWWPGAVRSDVSGEPPSSANAVEVGQLRELTRELLQRVQGLERVVRTLTGQLADAQSARRERITAAVTNA